MVHINFEKIKMVKLSDRKLSERYKIEKKLIIHNIFNIKKEFVVREVNKSFSFLNSDIAYIKDNKIYSLDNDILSTISFNSFTKEYEIDFNTLQVYVKPYITIWLGEYPIEKRFSTNADLHSYFNEIKLVAHNIKYFSNE